MPQYLSLLVHPIYTIIIITFTFCICFSVIQEELLSLMEADKKGRTVTDIALEMNNQQFVKSALNSGTYVEKFMLCETIFKKKIDDISDRDLEILEMCMTSLDTLQENASSVIKHFQTKLNNIRQKMKADVEGTAPEKPVMIRYQMNIIEWFQKIIDFAAHACSLYSANGNDKQMSAPPQGTASSENTMNTFMNLLSDCGISIDTISQFVFAGDEASQENFKQIFAAVEAGGSELETAMEDFLESTMMSHLSRARQLFAFVKSETLSDELPQILQDMLMDSEVLKVKFERNCQKSPMHMIACQRHKFLF